MRTRKKQKNDELADDVLRSRGCHGLTLQFLPPPHTLQKKSGRGKKAQPSESLKLYKPKPIWLKRRNGKRKKSSGRSLRKSGMKMKAGSLLFSSSALRHFEADGEKGGG
jgi:hypothetical protein